MIINWAKIRSGLFLKGGARVPERDFSYMQKTNPKYLPPIFDNFSKLSATEMLRNFGKSSKVKKILLLEN